MYYHHVLQHVGKMYNPLQYSCTEIYLNTGNLADYSPCSPKSQTLLSD